MQPGDRIGPFVVVRRLGAGQMGVVFEVSRPELGASYALKVLRRELCSAKDVLRFQREVEHLAAVSKHPHVVPIHAAGDDRGQIYYVMDLVRGETLQERLARGGPMNPERAARYVRDVASAVAYLHRAGIVHRDIKPGNVMVDERDQGRLTDFGLARTFGDDRNRLTMTGELVGTPHFMAPEQALGHPVGPPADVYALGMVLFTLLAGRPAVAGKGMIDILTRVGSGELAELPALAPDTPDALIDVVGRCFALEPERRPQAEQVWAALDEFLAEAAAGRVPPPRRSPWAGRVLALLAVGSVVLALTALALARRRSATAGAPSPTEAAATATTAVVASVARPAPAPAFDAEPWLVLARRAEPEDLRELALAVTPEKLTDEQRAALLAILARHEATWPQLGVELLHVPDHARQSMARSIERLLWLHALWRRLEPAHRLPEPRRGAFHSLVLAKLPPKAGLDLAFVRELSALQPEEVNHYVLYCDMARDPARHQEVLDLDLIRRGIEVAREQELAPVWGRLIKALGSHLQVVAVSDDGQLRALEALGREVEAAGWARSDAAIVLTHWGEALRNRQQLDAAIAVFRRALALAPEGRQPVGKLAAALGLRCALPDAKPEWLDEMRRLAVRFYELERAEPEPDEAWMNLTTQVCSRALEVHAGDPAAAELCARALGAGPPLGHVAVRRALLMCRSGSPEELDEALRVVGQRAERWAAAVERGPRPDEGFVIALRALGAGALELAEALRRQEVTQAEAAGRLAALALAARLLVPPLGDRLPPAPPR